MSKRTMSKPAGRYPKRPTCIVATGRAWQMLQLVGEPA